MALWAQARQAHRAFQDPVFTHGVACGDPGPDRLVIWTRVALDGQPRVPVQWLVARDPSMRRPLAQGETVAWPHDDGCVQVDVSGLPARCTLFYRFVARGRASLVGQGRTLPAHGLAPVRLAVVRGACHASGFFHAYAQVLRRHDSGPPLDAVVHLGDPAGDAPCDWTGTADALAAQRERLGRSRGDPDEQTLRGRLPWVSLGPAAAPGSACLQAWQEWTPRRLPDPARPERLRREFAFGHVLRLVLPDADPMAPGPAGLARHGTLWVLQVEADGQLQVHAADGRPVSTLPVPAVSGQPPGCLLLEADDHALRAQELLCDSPRDFEPRPVAGRSWDLARPCPALRPALRPA